jgi:ABC-type dipeptide/oligopeptide/nickel transport system permease subunit
MTTVDIDTAMLSPQLVERPAGRLSLLLRNGPAAAAFVWVTFVTVVCLVGPIVMNTDPSAISGRATFQGPSVAHWLGTDGLGRDVLARLVWGGRVSLFGAAFATAVSLGIGVPLGLAAGFFRGWTDRVLARSGDILLSMPPVVVALALIAIVGTGTLKAMLVVGIIFAPRMFRLVRSVTLVAGEATHVEAARSMGIGQSRILWSHVLPRAMSALLVQISVVLSASLLAEASLSFLGLGVQPPSSSWGVMLNRALEDIARSGFQVFPPGVVMVVTLFSFNLIADALRDSLQSQRQER